MVAKTCLPSGTRAHPMKTVLSAGTAVISLLSKIISPPHVLIRPEIEWSKVVFPAPFAPTIATISPGETCRETPLIIKDIFNVILGLRDAGTTVLLVEQNAKAALGIADRGYVLETGQIILDGEAEKLLHNKDVQRAYLGKEYKRIED